jgi:hypothetical protein
MNHETIKEISRLKIENFYSNDLDHLDLSWQNLGMGTKENIQGRYRHTAVSYKDKIYYFGGCFMFDHKRNVRECSN